MKKLILNLALIAFFASAMSAYCAPVTNTEIRAAVQKYKTKNYLGCLQDTEVMLKKDPSSSISYYYQALAYVQLGKTAQAMEAFNKVVTLNSNPTLVTHATRGIACINGDEDCKPKSEKQEDTELDTFIKSNKFYGNSVQADLNKKKLNEFKHEINSDIDVKTNQKSEMPTNDEIAQAVKTLAKIGVNPMAAMNGMNPSMMGQQNAEMMQMNMLLGNNNGNNNSMNSMLPMLMMQGQSGKNISPELIQTMMMSNMAGDMNYQDSTY